MKIKDLLSDPNRKWNKKEGAASSSIDSLSSNAPFELPKAYLDLLLNTNGGEGDLGVEPGWCQLWSADDVVRFNREYEVQVNLPGCFAFGSNGAGEMFILRKLSNDEIQVEMVPFIPMQMDEAVQVAPNFEEFINEIGLEYGG